MTEQGGEFELSQAERLHRAEKLMEAIAACEWEDAELVMSRFLYEFRCGLPQPPIGEMKDEAQFWARMATYDELLAYFIEAGKRLVQRRLGTRGRIRLAQRVLQGVPTEEIDHLVAELRSSGDKSEVA